jgi:hypothetical protein
MPLSVTQVSPTSHWDIDGIYGIVENCNGIWGYATVSDTGEPHMSLRHQWHIRDCWKLQWHLRNCPDEMCFIKWNDEKIHLMSEMVMQLRSSAFHNTVRLVKIVQPSRSYHKLFIKEYYTESLCSKKGLMSAPDELQMLLRHQPKKRLNAEAQVLQRWTPYIQSKFYYTTNYKTSTKKKSIELTISFEDLQRSTSSATESIYKTITHILLV